MSKADNERYARDRVRIRQRQAAYRETHGAKWQQARLAKYAVDPVKQTKSIWSTMIRRCHSPNHETFPYYGGRGIQVCAPWRESFDVFLADMGMRPKGRMIERRDGKGNYEPGNCFWATRSEQMKHR